jgi:anti-sigma factor ChrR (cupin superfamily)
VHGVVKDLALEFVMGALSPAARREVSRARLFDPVLDREIDALEAQFAPLTGAAGSISPPAGLFDRIVAALGAEEREHDGKFSQEAREGHWLPYKPGIEAKRLWNRRTIMLRCGPGARLPAHDHGEDEQIVVIAGDFVVGGRTLAAGDYHCSPKGNRHGECFTRNGCLLLVQYAA